MLYIHKATSLSIFIFEICTLFVDTKFHIAPLPPRIVSSLAPLCGWKQLNAHFNQKTYLRAPCASQCSIGNVVRICRMHAVTPTSKIELQKCATACHVDSRRFNFSRAPPVFNSEIQFFRSGIHGEVLVNIIVKWKRGKEHLDLNLSQWLKYQ